MRQVCADHPDMRIGWPVGDAVAATGLVHVITLARACVPVLAGRPRTGGATVVVTASAEPNVRSRRLSACRGVACPCWLVSGMSVGAGRRVGPCEHPVCWGSAEGI